MISNPQNWMFSAIDLARQAAHLDEVPVGALLVHKGEIIGRGANTREGSRRALAHAEILALEDYHSKFDAWRLPEETSLIVTVEPCLMCTGALIAARAKNIYYGCFDPKQAGLRRILPIIEDGVFDHKFSDVRGGILESECAALLTEFFRAKRQT